MPKIIELTVEIKIESVSCPGVWLCQDGRVSLSVFALGTNYQTCLLPPMFPLMFKDIFYFRKRFQESCTLSNMCCLLKGETIYCELVQWCEDCDSGVCTILAQYLGALNDVLFPSDICSNDGVDLLMRRSKEFPGILSPKIEIATKVRIDEVWNKGSNRNIHMKPTACQCRESDVDAARQKQVCHTPEYHRNKCTTAPRRPPSVSRSRSHSAAQSYCSLPRKPDRHEACKYPNEDGGPTPAEEIVWWPPPCLTVRQYVPGCPRTQRRRPAYPISQPVPCQRRPRSASRPRRPLVYNMNTGNITYTRNSNEIDDDIPPPEAHSAPRRRPPPGAWGGGSRPHPYYVYNVLAGNPSWAGNNVEREDIESEVEIRSDNEIRLSDTDKMTSPTDERLQKILLESRFIEEDHSQRRRSEDIRSHRMPRFVPCLCEICKRYHELFHSDSCSTKTDQKV